MDWHFIKNEKMDEQKKKTNEKYQNKKTKTNQTKGSQSKINKNLKKERAFVIKYIYIYK